jgi:hypothetical protein
MNASSGSTDPSRMTTEQAAERAVGSFVCARPDQWYLGYPGPQACGCCTGNGARVLYHAWDSIFRSDGEELQVNLLLNRASAWADLDSYLPYEGKVVLKLKQPKNVLIRIPSWTQWEKVACLVNGKPSPFQWAGRYIRIESLQTGQTLTVEFPMTEKTLHRNLKGEDFEIGVRGFTVVDLQPHRNVTPVFRREHYLQSEAPMKKIKRFVCEHDITW